MVDETEVSENKETLIILAGTVAGAATTFVASLLIPLEIKAPATALATTVTGAILLYWKNKVKNCKHPLFSFLFPTKNDHSPKDSRIGLPQLSGVFFLCRLRSGCNTGLSSYFINWNPIN